VAGFEACFGQLPGGRAGSVEQLRIGEGAGAGIGQRDCIWRMGGARFKQVVYAVNRWHLGANSNKAVPFASAFVERRNQMMRPPLSLLTAELPSTVPFVGPEAQERARGGAFQGAHRCQ
jgi:hypothetical protein